MKKRYWLWCGTFVVVLDLLTSFLSRFPLFDFLKYVARPLHFTTYIVGLPVIHDTLSPVLFALAYIPFVGFILYIVSFAGVDFCLGALVGKIFEKVKQNKIALTVFFLILFVLLGMRTYEYKQKFFAATPSDCQAFERSFDKNACLLDLAVKNRDIDMCHQMPDEDVNKSDCYVLIADEIREYSICNDISNEEYKNRCLSEVANIKGECDKTLSPDYCRLYRSESVRVSARDGRCDVFADRSGINSSLCLRFKAGEIDTKTLCREIKDDKIRQQCVSYDISGTEVIYGADSRQIKLTQ